VHVLAVDDDPSARQLITDYLGYNDIRVTALESGKQIRKVTEREAVDLLVLDLRLPGAHLRALLRRRQALASRVPDVARISTNAIAASTRRMLRATNRRPVNRTPREGPKADASCFAAHIHTDLLGRCSRNGRNRGDFL
jgi:CheY-like chemotaxis protein